MLESDAMLIEALPFGAACCDAQGRVLRGNRRLRELLVLPDDEELSAALAAVLGTDWFARLPFEFRSTEARQLALSLGGSDAIRLLIVEDRSETALADAARDHVVKRLSHDLRSPIAAIIGLAHSVVEGLFPPDRESFDRIVQQAELALGRSDALLAVLRAAALAPERMVPIDLVRVIHEAHDVCYAAAKRRGVALRVEEPSGPDGAECLVRGELELLRRAVQQIAELALPHCAGNALVLRLCDADTHWRIEARPTHATQADPPTEADLLLLRILAHKHGGYLAIDPANRQPQLLCPKLPAEDAS